MDHNSGLQMEKWIKEQDSLKRRVVLEDGISWRLPTSLSNKSKDAADNNLHYIGGLDVSFSKENPSIACAALVVLDIETFSIVYEDYEIFHLTTPYIPGFLAFREGPVLSGLLNKMKCNHHPFYPQIIMVDGNGILHPRGFGLACHLGVMSNLPSIGIGKNLHNIDGLTITKVREYFSYDEASIMLLKGNSGQTWGAALRSTKNCLKPVFISVGHHLSLETAITIVKACCKYRIPEPVRQADIRSREYLLKNNNPPVAIKI